jgi:hypothetical protein
MPDELKPNPAGKTNWGDRWGRLPTWAKWVIGVVAVFILLGIGGAIGGSGSKEGDLKDEISALETKVSNAEGETKTAEGETGDAEAKAEEVEAAESKITQEAKVEATEITANAKSKATGVAEKAEKEASAAQHQASDAKGELKSVESELTKTEESLGIVKEEKVKSTIPSSGTFVLGKDYEAGLYEAKGGELCSWEQDQQPGGEAGGESFNGNYGFGESHILIEITSPYFKTQNCGTWHRIIE